MFLILRKVTLLSLECVTVMSFRYDNLHERTTLNEWLTLNYHYLCTWSAGDFIMAVGEHNVSSLTREKFEELLQQKFIGVVERMRLTLRKASEKACTHKEFKLGAIQKECKLRPADLSLALVFCEDKSRELPINFPLRNYDIIYQVRDWN